MKLDPTRVDPKRLLKPTSVAERLSVHPSMVTHWMQGNTLDYVDIDGVKFIPEENVAVLETLRRQREEERSQKRAQDSRTSDFAAVS